MTDPRPRCFIIMPVSTPDESIESYMGDREHFQHVLTHLFVPAAEKAGYEAVPPIMGGADIIHAEIIRNLETCEMVLCDMSTHNPNVFFELGIRVALDKPICLVKDSTTSKIPFDTTLINHYAYEPSLTPWILPNEVTRISEHIKKASDGALGRNTLWRYFGLSTRAELPSTGSIDEKLGLILRVIEEKFSGQMLPEALSTESRPARLSNVMQDVLEKAQAIAREVRAELEIKEMSPRHVVFDLDGYTLPRHLADKIVKLAKKHNIVASFVSEGEGGII